LDNLIYEDNPNPYMWSVIPIWKLGWEIYIKLQLRYLSWYMNIIPVWLIILFAGFLLALPHVEQEWVFLPIIWTALLIMLIISFALMPTRYQIFTDRIRIVLGWVIHFNIPFSNIENVTSATFGDLWGLNLNFINSYSSDDILQITRKRGAKVHITPWDRKVFLENLDKTIAEWRKYNISY
jgi:hypothetical protein